MVSILVSGQTLFVLYYNRYFFNAYFVIFPVRFAIRFFLIVMALFKTWLRYKGTCVFLWILLKISMNQYPLKHWTWCIVVLTMKMFTWCFLIFLFASYLVPKAPTVPDRYITLILHNTLGRRVRVLPSKGRHRQNGYVVKAHSFMKVSIIIKGEKYVEPITFRGEDLETGSKLLLNKALFPISSTPSNTPDDYTNISITAEGTTSLDLCLNIFMQ